MEIVLLLAVLGSNAIGKLSAAVISKCNINGDFGTLMGMEYKMVSQRKDHQEALKSCQDWGKDRLHSGLVDIVNEQVQDCLEKLILASQYRSSWNNHEDNIYHRALHVGGSDKKEEKVWRWGNNEIIPLRGEDQFEKWGIYEPNDFQTEDCLALLHSEIGDGYTMGTWLDLSCLKELPFICQREAVVKEEETVSPAVFPYEEIKKSSDSCSGVGQSPIDLYTDTKCTVGGSGQVGKIRYWGSTHQNVRWKVQNMNDGEYVKIFFKPARAVFTVFDDNPNKRYYVEYAHLKWGTGSDLGSEHSVLSRKRNLESGSDLACLNMLIEQMIPAQRNGNHLKHKLQIFHYQDGEPKKQAVAFVLSNIGNVPHINYHWSFLLRSMRSIQHVHWPRDVTNTPSDFFMSLLRFGNESPYRTLRIAIRYEGSMTVSPGGEEPITPCGVIWTVYTEPIKISTGQIRFFHDFSSGTPNRNGIRPIQSSTGVPQCYIQ